MSEPWGRGTAQATYAAIWIVSSGMLRAFGLAFKYLSTQRRLSSLPFDRNLKARQKMWALGQEECLEAAAGFRNEIERGLFERVKVTWGA